MSNIFILAVVTGADVATPTKYAMAVHHPHFRQVPPSGVAMSWQTGQRSHALLFTPHVLVSVHGFN